MTERFKDRPIDFRTLTFLGVQSYLQIATDPQQHDARDAVLTNIWYLLEPFWKGRDSLGDFDYTEEWDRLLKSRRPDSSNLVGIDAQRLGVIMKTLHRKDPLLRTVQIFEVGVPVREDSGEMILDE